MKNKRGFTLLELLAVIVILSVLVVIAVTKIGNVIDDARKEAYKATNTMIVNQVKGLNSIELVPQTYTFTNGVSDPDIKLNGELPKNGTVEINADGQIQLATSNDKYCAIKRFNESEVAVYNVGNRLCNIVLEITLTVDPNGGIYDGTTNNSTYSIETDATKELDDPIRSGYTFKGWNSTCEECLTDNIYTASSVDGTVTANWQGWPSLTLSLGGGTTSQTFEDNYEPDSIIPLTNPTKSGSVFTGWSVSGTGSTLNGGELSIGTGNTILTANFLAYEDMFTYSGSKEIVDDGDGNWRIKFLTDGTFKPLINITIDAFLVGGGGGGGNSSGNGANGGGGGGYTKTQLSINLTANTNYSIDVGTGGGAETSGSSTTAFTYSASGGIAATGATGGAGGSGGGGSSGYNASYPYAGYGGSDGSNGGSGAGDSTAGAGGAGQGSTTKEFGETAGALYGAGGSGGVHNYGTAAWVRAGGATGGGTGGSPNVNGSAAVANTGGGGGGGAGYMKAGGSGASGIVIIRNTKIITVGNTVKYTFKCTGPYQVINGSTDDWKVRFLGNSTFIPLQNMTIDAFLVGGGGGGGSSDCHSANGGGGGGYTKTQSNITLTANTSYSITIGVGGGAEANGTASTAFTYSAAGGNASTGYTGGAGGSGGGGSSGYNSSYPFAGYGGSDGSNGGAGAGDSTAGAGGIGQGTTTREFGELLEALYGAGGSGGVHEYGTGSWVRSGGATGGGTGGSPNVNGSAGAANTGGGGGGGAGYMKAGGSGGSGIVIIRAS